MTTDNMPTADDDKIGQVGLPCHFMPKTDVDWFGNSLYRPAWPWNETAKEPAMPDTMPTGIDEAKRLAVEIGAAIRAEVG